MRGKKTNDDLEFLKSFVSPIFFLSGITSHCIARDLQTY